MARTSFARIARGEMLSLRERDFVLVARHLGVSERRIIWRHLLPQLRSQIGVVLCNFSPLIEF